MDNKKPSKHLTRDDRVRIETFLNENRSVRYIATRLDKSPSTISREIRNHSDTRGAKFCDCIYYSECKKHHVCGGLNNVCTKMCRTCQKAKRYCADYVKTLCDFKTEHHTAVCNGCGRRGLCHFDKSIYRAAKADKEYREMLVESRNGFDLSGEDLESINATVSPLVMKGQSVYHILQSNKLPVSESTLRRLIDKSKLDARNIDLRNAVKRKRRQHRIQTQEYRKMSVIKDGHKYEDYLTYIEANPIPAVQMDCVEGKKTDKAVLLTLHFPIPRLQLAFVLNEHTSKCVVEALDMIEESLGSELFKEMFPLILTDNGHEFEDIDGIERSIFGGKRTTVFFCEPRHSEQKGSCEKNHELIRYVIPKGTSLEPYSQPDITLMMNHVNSYIRKELHGKSPYDVVKAMFPEDFFILLGLEQIPPTEVHLKPSLLK